MRCNLSSGATTSSASQAILYIIQNTHIHYCCSQEPTSCPIPEPEESSPQPPIPFFVMHFNISRPSMSSFSNWFCPSGSHTKILYVFFFSLTHDTSLAHLILLSLNNDDDDDDDDDFDHEWRCCWSWWSSWQWQQDNGGGGGGGNGDDANHGNTGYVGFKNVIPVITGQLEHFRAFINYLHNILGKHDIQELQNSHTEHCTRTADSTNITVQNIQREKYHHMHHKL